MAPSLSHPEYPSPIAAHKFKLTIASPYRLLQFGKAAYQTTRARLRDTHTHFTLGTLRTSLLDKSLFRRIAFPTRLPGTLAAIDSSLDSLCRHEIETNLLRLRSLRELQAAGLGLLVSEGIDFSRGRDWKEGIVRGVDMMKSTMEWLQNVDVQTETTNQIDDGILFRADEVTDGRTGQVEVDAREGYLGCVY
jgi:hypothetical protein